MYNYDLDYYNKQENETLIQLQDRFNINSATTVQDGIIFYKFKLLNEYKEEFKLDAICWKFESSPRTNYNKELIGTFHVELKNRSYNSDIIENRFKTLIFEEIKKEKTDNKPNPIYVNKSSDGVFYFHLLNTLDWSNIKKEKKWLKKHSSSNLNQKLVLKDIYNLPVINAKKLKI